MVATRNHPRDFEPPATESPTKPSPTKRMMRTSTANDTAPTKTASPPQTPTKTRSSASSAPTRAQSGWSHTPSNLTLIWLAISLPLVIWDTGYVVLRPYSMPGGALHAPIWTPYRLYGEIDHTYGFKAYNRHEGWTLAQGSINGLETAVYIVYLYLVYQYGQQEEIQGRGAPDRALMGRLKSLSESRTVYGKMAGWVVLLGFSTATVTFWKTVLYMLIEVFSGFDNIGHNSWVRLIFMWIIPNGAWIVLPAYMTYVFGQEILEGLEVAAEGNKKSK